MDYDIDVPKWFKYVSWVEEIDGVKVAKQSKFEHQLL